MQLIRRESSATITARATDGAGMAVEPDSAKVTITRDSDGEVIADGAAVQVDGSKLACTVKAEDVPRVDLLHVTWEIVADGAASTLRQQVGVVGAFICSLQEIAEAVEGSARSEPTPEQLAAARAKAETLLEERCNVAFRPTYHREVLRGEGGEELVVSRPRLLSVRSVTISGRPISIGEVAPSIAGTVVRADGWPEGAEIEVAYEHGWPMPPDDVREAAIKLARDYLLADPSDYDQRAGRIETAEAVYGFLTTAGVGGAVTSIPEVNAVIEAYRHPVIA